MIKNTDEMKKNIDRNEKERGRNYKNFIALNQKTDIIIFKHVFILVRDRKDKNETGKNRITEDT